MLQLNIRTITTRLSAPSIEDEKVHALWIRLDLHDADGNEYVAFLSREQLQCMAPDFPVPRAPQPPVKPKRHRKRR